MEEPNNRICDDDYRTFPDARAPIISYQPNSFEDSELSPIVSTAEQQRPWSYDERFFQANDSRICETYFVGGQSHPKILDKESQNQIDEFEEVISRMASMTRNPYVPVNPDNKQPVVVPHVPPPYGSQEIPFENDCQADAQHCLQFRAGVCSQYGVAPDSRAGITTCSTPRLSPRSTPYPAPVSSPSSGTIDSSRRPSGELLPSYRPRLNNTQIQPQVNENYVYDASGYYQMGLPPLA